MDLEGTAQVASSVQRLKDKIEKTLRQLTPGSALQNDLSKLHFACNDFLSKTNLLSEKLRMYISKLKDQVEQYDKTKTGSEPTPHTRTTVEHYRYIGEPDLIKNERINIAWIQPESSKFQFIFNLEELRHEFGTRLMFLAARTACVIPDLLKPLIH